MITEGIYTADEIAKMGLNVNETTSAQQVGGQWYKLDNTGDGRRKVSIVTPKGSGQGSGGFTYGTSGADISGMFGSSATQQINLPELYKSLYSSSGIAALEQDYAAKQQAYNQAQAQINDNPFLSEASRVGRIQKLSMDYNNNIAALQNQIATKKADLETQLNLQAKQYDINSAAAQQALSQFNSLLEMGALDSASATDIANITRATGLSSSAIQSAINARKAANQKAVDTQVMTYDDGINQGYAVIDSATGEIINKQVISSSKSSSSGGSSSGSSGGLTATQQKKAISVASKVLSAKGKDKWVDLKEFNAAVTKIINEMGIGREAAIQYAAQAMVNLGLKKYKW